MYTNGGGQRGGREGRRGGRERKGELYIVGVHIVTCSFKLNYFKTNTKIEQVVNLLMQK